MPWRAIRCEPNSWPNDYDSHEGRTASVQHKKVYIGGEAYLAAGQGSAAAVEFQKIIDHNGLVWNCWTGALAHLGVARAKALQSITSQGADADAARTRGLATDKDFFALGKDAEPEIPILKQAKEEYTRLQ